MFLKAPDIYIRVEGKKTIQRTAKNGNRAFTATGLKVLFQFLQNKDLVNEPQRTIAQKAGVARGNITQVLDGLKETGYLMPLNKKEFLWEMRQELLQRWVEKYTLYTQETNAQLMKNYRLIPIRKANWKCWKCSGPKIRKKSLHRPCLSMPICLHKAAKEIWKPHKSFTMNTSNQTYKKLAIPHFKEVFDIIDTVMQRYHTPYYLIGASAVALELLKNDIKPGRGTRDIDFAIMTANHDAYQKACKALRKHGFQFY